MYQYQPYYQPYQNYQTQSYQNNQMSLTRVTGIEGAKAYQMPANSTVALFDNNEDLMYIKTTDGAGFPTIRTFSFKESVPQTIQPEYITREEFNKLKEELLNGKQSISKSNNKHEHTEVQQRTNTNG